MNTPPAPAAADELALPPELEPRDWYFTFGSGHRLHVQRSPDEPSGGTGIHLLG